MGKETLTKRELEKFLKSNDFKSINTTGHNVVQHIPTGSTVTINWHRSRGKGIAYDTLRDLAKIFKITKAELVIYAKSKMKEKLPF